MGDHRANIKIEMKAHGKIYCQEWWINWSPDGDGCDRRITEWFETCWCDAYSRYDAEVNKYFREQRERDEKKSDLDTLARLKAKYETSER